ncbi:MAG: hypothetical protein U0166_01650 [Acidobacteriota bacterium]
MLPLLYIGIGVAVFVGLIALEGRRQERRYGKRSTGERLMRVGLMELQAMLEPDRKMELLIEEEDDRKLPSLAGDKPETDVKGAPGTGSIAVRRRASGSARA